MLSRAINMLRSMRGSMDFYTDEERDNSNVNISVESSPRSNGIEDNYSDVTVVDEVENPFPHGFMSIQSRASIRMKTAELGNTLHEVKNNKSSETFMERNNCENSDVNVDSGSDDDVMIIEGTPENKAGHKKDLSHSAGSSFGRRDPFNEDNEMDGPLEINFDEKCNSLEESSDSQSSYYTSPQEVFDLSKPEPKVYKSKKRERNKETKKKVTKVASPVERVTRSRAAINKTSPKYAVSQSLLQECANHAVINLSDSSECPSTKSKKNNKEDKADEEDKVRTTEDERIRLKLPIHGKKKKKLFSLKMSQIIAMVSDKNHPLHKWQDLITLENMNKLPQEDKKNLLKILIGFLEVKLVRIKGRAS